jgi:predicted transglutaminase-like cysteine proteinase
VRITRLGNRYQIINAGLGSRAVANATNSESNKRQTGSWIKRAAWLLPALMLSTSTAADAQDWRTAALLANPKLAFAATGGETSIPIGWVGFCRENPAECARPVRASAGGADPAPLELTPASWRLLVAVNARVNRTIQPITDQDHWGVTERWSYPDDGKGDCEDYALLKRRILMQAGIPRHALLMTVVRDNNGEGHAILTVVTDKGDLVLDNKRGRILSWSRTGYTFLKRQSRIDQNEWVSIGEPEPMTATATAPARGSEQGR